jgi:hypothetical protein
VYALSFPASKTSLEIKGQVRDIARVTAMINTTLRAAPGP